MTFQLFENEIPINMHVLHGERDQIVLYEEGAVFIHAGWLTFKLGGAWGSSPITDHVFISPTGALVSRAGDGDFSRFRRLEA